VKAAAIPLSLSYYTVPELAPPAMVGAAADAGFDFVGVRLLNGQPGRDPAPLLESPALRRETLACCQKLYSSSGKNRHSRGGSRGALRNMTGDVTAATLLQLMTCVASAEWSAWMEICPRI